MLLSLPIHFSIHLTIFPPSSSPHPCLYNSSLQYPISLHYQILTIILLFPLTSPFPSQPIHLSPSSSPHFSPLHSPFQSSHFLCLTNLLKQILTTAFLSLPIHFSLSLTTYSPSPFLYLTPYSTPFIHSVTHFLSLSLTYTGRSKQQFFPYSFISLPSQPFHLPHPLPLTTPTFSLPFPSLTVYSWKSSLQCSLPSFSLLPFPPSLPTFLFCYPSPFLLAISHFHSLTTISFPSSFPPQSITFYLSPHPSPHISSFYSPVSSVSLTYSCRSTL